MTKYKMIERKKVVDFGWIAILIMSSIVFGIILAYIETASVLRVDISYIYYHNYDISIPFVINTVLIFSLLFLLFFDKIFYEIRIFYETKRRENS